MTAELDTVLAAIDTRKRAEQVRDIIVDLIQTRDLEPGDKLPTERQLMKRLGVGRSTVREALHSLVGLGVVEARPGRGFYVGQLSIEDVTRALSGALHLRTEVSWKLVEARSIIEVASGRLAAERRTAKDLESIEEAVQRLREAYDAYDLDTIVAADHSFHAAIVRATHNEVLIAMLSSIAPWLAKHQRELYEHRMENGIYDREFVVGSHKVIQIAVADGDADEAEKQVRGHLQPIWEQVRIWPLA